MWLSASIRDVMSWIRGVGSFQVHQGHIEEVKWLGLKSSSRGRAKGEKVRTGVRRSGEWRGLGEVLICIFY